MLLDLNSKGQHQVKGKEKESRSLVFTSSRKPCAVSRRSCALMSKRCTKKGDVFFVANLNLLLFAVLVAVAVVFAQAKMMFCKVVPKC